MAATLKLAKRRAPAIAVGWLVLVILAAAAVRILGLGNTDLWGDEAFSVMTSLGPPSKLLGILSASEPHPPLYPFMLAAWLRLFGSSEFVARLPSAFCGIASVPVAAALARSFAPDDKRRLAMLAAVIAGLLVALNPFQVWYSQEARMYAQVSFFAGLATLALLRLWRGRRGAIPIYALALLGAAGSHYYGLFIPLAHGLAVLVFARGNRPALLRWIRGTALAAVLYLPWVVVAFQIFAHYYGGPPGSENLPQVALSAWARVTAGWSLEWSQAVTFASALSAIAIFGLLVPVRSDDDRFLRVVLFFWLATPVVGGYVVSLVRPLYNERYLIVCSLPFILLMTRGISWLLSPGLEGIARWKRSARTMAAAVVKIPAGLVALAGALAMAYVALHNVWIGEYIQSAYNTPVKTVDLLARPGDAVILDGSSQLYLYQYYARKPLPLFTLPTAMRLDPATTTAELARIARDHSGAWVFWYATPNYDPHNVIGRWLAENAYRSLDVYATNARLQYYRFAPAATLKTRTTDLTFGKSLELQSYAYSAAKLSAGATVPIDLHWRRLSGAAPHLRVALRLVDASGLIWAQIDQSVGNGYVADSAWPASQQLDDRHGLLIPDGIPPGEYLVKLNVYSADHPEAMAVTGQGAEITPGGVTLATVHVSAPSKLIWTGGIGGFHPSAASFANGLSLLGYAGSDQVTAGESGYLTLVWKALQSAPRASDLRLELLTKEGKIVEQRDLPLATNSYPPAKWQAGDVLREQYQLPIDDKLAAGTYRVAVQPVAASSPSGVVSASSVLGLIQVKPGAPRPVVKPPQHPLSYTLAGKLALSGYDLSASQLKPGATLDLTLHWHDIAPIDGNYTVFVHVLDASNKIVAQHDQPPAAGKRPTSSWFAGDTILDQYQLTLPAKLPSGSYTIEVGMYNPSNGVRLPVEKASQPAGDRIILTHLTVAS